jgi:hypothetical protein
MRVLEGLVWDLVWGLIWWVYGLTSLLRRFMT